MVSGIDISARLISLAINIAIMGLILIEGVLSTLKTALPNAASTLPLRALAERIASGATTGREVPGSVVHDALVNGFGWVMLYGGISVWILAAFSYVTFGHKATVPVSEGASEAQLSVPGE